VKLRYKSDVRRVISVGLLAALCCARCGGDRGPDTDLGTRFPSEPCSELAHAVYHWRGEEGQACDTQSPQPRELHALGDGYVLEWLPQTGAHRVWIVGGEKPLGADAAIDGVLPLTGGHVLVSLGGLRVLDNQVLFSEWQLRSVSVGRGPRGNVLATTVKAGSWSTPTWGRDMMILDDDHLLEWWPGDGHYLVRRYDRANESDAPFTTTTFAGTNKDLLLRGARLVNLGGHRLLEWIPHLGTYRVWSYAFDTNRGDIFGADPLAEGRWDGLGKDDELLVVAANRILVWQRSTGHVSLRELPATGDPLAGALLSEALYPQLRAADPERATTSNITNVVIVLQRGRSFDSYFGQYCGGVPGSAPSCTAGPACCEGMPAAIPGAPACAQFDPAVIDVHVPNESVACMKAKMNGGAMDAYATAPGCGSPLDFACAGPTEGAGAIGAYHTLAAEGALADRFFQSMLGIAELNLIYLNKAASGFSIATERGPQLTQRLAEARVRWAIYVEDPFATQGQSPPQFYDPRWTHFRWVNEIHRDILLEQLPAVSIVIPPPALSEQPGAAPAAAGIELVTRIADELRASPRYGNRALALVTHLTSGGYYDHVAPPPAPGLDVDEQNGQPVPYGPRVPLLAVGPFARRNHISHAQLELSSLTVFLEWNWGGGMTGQLGRRDTIASNIGSLLDPAKTGVLVPE
jgi:hypothetical protein